MKQSINITDSDKIELLRFAGLLKEEDDSESNKESIAIEVANRIGRESTNPREDVLSIINAARKYQIDPWDIIHRLQHLDSKRLTVMLYHAIQSIIEATEG